MDVEEFREMRLKRARHNVLHDEDAAARFRTAADRLQDLGAFAVVPIVEDHLEAVDIGMILVAVWRGPSRPCLSETAGSRT